MNAGDDALCLLMTDVVGSTRRWAKSPAAMNVAMTRHHDIMLEEIERHGGWRPVDQGEGDSVFAAFPTPDDAVATAFSVQSRLADQVWPAELTLEVRMGLHVGECVRRGGNLFGDTVNRCARIRDLAHGRQVLISSDFAAALAATDVDVTVSDLGEHVLRGLDYEEKIYQVDGPGGRSAFPELVSFDRPRHNLPAGVSSFFGRDREVGELVDLLSAERLVTVIGFGGVGKTRLVLQAAARLEKLQDEVWFVDLSSVDSASAVPAEIARVLGVRETGEGPGMALAAGLRDRRLLLVLDNLEQVLDCAGFLSEMLAAAPDVRMLATSREPLRLMGEIEYALAPLPLESAVSLFLNRAAARRRNAVDPKDLGDVEAICQRLDGQPLAIELAAARVSTLSVHALADRLETSMNALLKDPARDRPLRQQTVIATIAWSYDTLKPGEALLLDRLSVFPGPATLEAVEAICSGEHSVGHDLPPEAILDAVTALVEKSLLRLVTRDQDPEAQEPRYQLLMTIREYAAGQAAGRGETESLVARHARFYMDLVGPLVNDDEDDEEREADQIRRDDTHVRAVVTWAQDQPDPSAELSLARLAAVWDNLGYMADSARFCQHLLSRGSPPSAERGYAFNYLLRAMSWMGNLEAIAVSQAYLDEARKLDDPGNLAIALTWRANFVMTSAEAAPLMDEAADLVPLIPADAIFDSGLVRSVLLHLAKQRFRYFQPDRALAAAEELAAEDTDPAVLAGRCLELSRIYADRGRWDEAEAVLERARVLEAESGLTLNLAERRLAARAIIEAGRGLHASALESLTASVAILAEKGMAAIATSATVAMAESYLQLGDTARARLLIEEALPKLAATGNKHWVAGAQWKLAAVHRREGRLDLAEPLLQAALPLLVETRAFTFTSLLVALLEYAAVTADRDPDGAAYLLRLVQEHRGDFVLSFMGAETASMLTDQLADHLPAGEPPSLDEVVNLFPPVSEG